MNVRVLYFAVARELAGISEEVLVVPDHVRTVAHLAAHLEAVHEGLRGRLGAMRFARNEEFASLGEPIADGDVLALIPPVAGG